MALLIVRRDEAPVRFSDRVEGPPSTIRYFGNGSDYETKNSAHRTEAFNREVKAHFHAVDQYQIFLGAPGALYARRPLTAEFSLHYSDAYKTYGPFSGADEPLVYFTLRAQHSDMTGYMPGSRDELKWVGRRHYFASFERLQEHEYPNARSVRFEPVIEPHDDGLAAVVIIAGPSASIELPDTHGTNGQYIYVAEGSVALGKGEYGEQSLAWQDAEEGSTTVEAGQLGARLFALQFPSPSTVEQKCA